MASEVVENEAAAETPQGGRRGLFRIIQAVAFVSVVVVVEIVVASMLVPSAEETKQLAEDLANAQAGKDSGHADAHGDDHGHDSGGHGDGHSHDVHEVDLGNYNITRYNPATNTTLAIDFELYGTVLAEEASHFEHEFDNSKARIREQIIMTMHSVESADLNDAGLGLIKRRILEKTNRALGEPVLKEVLFSKFNFVER